MSVSQQLLDFLRCPRCHASVFVDGDRVVCRDETTRLAYPIRDGIPVMVVDEATTLSPSEWNDAVARHELAAATARND